MLYKNTSCSEKTFHGVKFKPGEVHDVLDYINDIAMIPVSEAPNKVTIKSQQKLSGSKKASHDTKPQTKDSDEPVKEPECDGNEEQVD